MPRTTRRMAPLILLLIACSAGCVAARRERTPMDRTLFLFAYFTGNGEDGMKYALSEEGRAYRHVPGPVLRSTLGEGLIRDPSIIRGPDGRYHCVWTTGWWTRAFGLAHSDDLLRWSEPRPVPVMESIEGAANVWAPEIHWDPERREYLVLWSSTVRGRFEGTRESSELGPDGIGLNHRIWSATSPDLASWSIARPFYDPGFNCIDGAIVRDPVRARWCMVLKDETLTPEPRKGLCVAFADRMQGAYGAPSAPITPPGVWAEGPAIIRDGDAWLILYDRYAEGRFGAVRTRDFAAFEAVDPPVLPKGARHGSIISIPETLAAAIQASACVD